MSSAPPSLPDNSDTAAADDASTPGETAGSEPPVSGGQGPGERPTTDDDAPAATRPRQGPTLVLAGLALVLALANGGGLYYLWTRDRQVDQAVARATERQDELAARAGSLDQRLQEQSRTLASLQSDQQQLRGRMDGIETLPEELKAQAKAQQERLQSQAKAQQARLEQALAEVRAALPDPRRWARAEARYLLVLANERLQVARDTAGARAALAAADRRLQAMDDPRYLPVREAIGRDLAAVKLVPEIDLAGINAALDGLIGQIDRLPLEDVPEMRAPRPADEAAAPVADNGTGQGWQSVLERFWLALKGLVSISRDDRAVTPLLAPEQGYFLRANLRLQLDAARLAALRAWPDGYTDALDQARDWVGEYYAEDAPVTRAFLGELQKLRDRAIRPELPDISDSLEALRRVSKPDQDQGA